MIEKEEFIKKNARSGIIACSIIAALSVIGFTCIVKFDSDKSDIPVFVLVLGILLATCIFGIIKFSKQYKEPWKVMPQQTSVNQVRTRLYNAEWNWDVAEANYRVQYNKSGTLTDQDIAVIWKYCAAEISYILAWIIDRNFMNPDSVTEADIMAVRRREISPDEIMESIDMKLIEDDVSEEIWPFLEYYFDEESERVDDFLEKVSKSKTNILPDQYSERDNRHCNFAFDWGFYDEFKEIKDKEYKQSEK